ncbi:MAG TPA: prephenate dehydrogenase [Actinomycetota bacterium]|nr:prephenate dehydrogenase [Actinomycetota bacterium]
MTWSEPRRVAILGTGLIGTSIGMAARRNECAVRGFDEDLDVLARAARRGGLEEAGGLSDCVSEADLVFVCTPIATIPELAARALEEAPGAIVTDVGSVKAHVVSEVEGAVGDPSRFVGGHPMGGSELSGPDGASASLLDGIAWVLTPTATTAPEAVVALERWVGTVGAEAMRMAPARHDRMVAMVSHLPQVASTALMGLAATEEADEPEILLLAAGGFRDLTRLAASNPGLWGDILVSNRKALAASVDLYIERLEALRDLVVQGRVGDVEAAFAEAKRARLTLAAKPKVRAGVAVIQVPVPDRPGVLASLAATLGEHSVNIEDLQIVHSPEGGRGTVHLTVAAEDAALAAEAVEGAGFESTRLA